MILVVLIFVLRAQTRRGEGGQQREAHKATWGDLDEDGVSGALCGAFGILGAPVAVLMGAGFWTVVLIPVLGIGGLFFFAVRSALKKKS